MAEDAGSMLGIAQTGASMLGEAARDMATIVSTLLNGLFSKNKDVIERMVSEGDSIGTIDVPGDVKDEFLPALEKANIPYAVADPEIKPVGIMILVVPTSMLEQSHEQLKQLELKDPAKYYVGTPEKANEVFGNKRVVELNGLSREESLLICKELQNKEAFFQVEAKDNGTYTIKTLERDEKKLGEAYRDIVLDLNSDEKDILLNKLNHDITFNESLNNIIHGKDYKLGEKDMEATIMYDSMNPEHNVVIRKDGFVHYVGEEVVEELGINDPEYASKLSAISRNMVEPDIKSKSEFKDMTPEQKGETYQNFLKDQDVRLIIDERRGRKYKSIEVEFSEDEPGRVETSLIADVAPDIEAEIRTLKDQLDEHATLATVARYHQEKVQELETTTEIGSELATAKTEHEELLSKD